MIKVPMHPMVLSQSNNNKFSTHKHNYLQLHKKNQTNLGRNPLYVLLRVLFSHSITGSLGLDPPNIILRLSIYKILIHIPFCTRNTFFNGQGIKNYLIMNRLFFSYTKETQK